MGARHPDRIRQPPSYMEALTLGEIYVANWEMMAHCPACNLRLRVSAASYVKLYGPGFVLWGKSLPCPNMECSGGKLAYFARSIPGGSWEPMKAEPRPEVVEAWHKKRRISENWRGPR